MIVSRVCENPPVLISTLTRTNSTGGVGNILHKYSALELQPRPSTLVGWWRLVHDALRFHVVYVFAAEQYFFKQVHFVLRCFMLVDERV